MTVGLAACTSASPESARVKVYEADLSAPESSRALPAGCKLLSTTAPVDQMESERHISDPYRVQRNDTAAHDGNVLLVLSGRFVTRYKTDCASSDTSPDCQNRGQNWYKVSFASYSCDAAADQALAANAAAAAASSSGGGWRPFGSKKAKPAPAAAAAPAPAPAMAPSPAPAAAARAGTAPSELKANILVLMREGVGTDVIVAFVQTHRPAAALSAGEILDWKKSGIAEPVIEAALAQAVPTR
ncbi:MAG: hypothetical protein ABI968_06570 [Acidobacteriota bacterium]